MSSDDRLPFTLRRAQVPALADRPGLYELAMRYGDLRAQAAASAARDEAVHAQTIHTLAAGFGRVDHATDAYHQAVAVADALAGWINRGLAPPDSLGEHRRRELEGHWGRFARSMVCDPRTDHAAHVALTTIRQLVAAVDAALMAEGVDRDARDRVINTVLYGDADGPRARVDPRVLAEKMPLSPDVWGALKPT